MCTLACTNGAVSVFPFACPGEGGSMLDPDGRGCPGKGKRGWSRASVSHRKLEQQA
jgi:hypothetical protein